MSVFAEFALTLFIALVALAIILVISLSRRTSNANSDVPVPYISRRTGDWIFLGMASAYALVFGTLAILRHQSFHSGGFKPTFGSTSYGKCYVRCQDVCCSRHTRYN
jgi:hypothetical protein